MSFNGRGRRRTDLIEKDNNNRNRGNRGGRAVFILFTSLFYRERVQERISLFKIKMS